jgi:hypothetical protein
MLNKQIFIDALTATQRNPAAGAALVYLLRVADNVETVNGLITVDVDLRPYDTNAAQGLAVWDNYECCNALITHDLHQFSVRDLSRLIAKIRGCY